jgi:hypothetical protein
MSGYIRLSQHISGYISSFQVRSDEFSLFHFKSSYDMLCQVLSD